MSRMKPHAVADTPSPSRVRQWDLYDLDMLARIQPRVLWLSTYIVHYPNFVWPNPVGLGAVASLFGALSTPAILGRIFPALSRQPEIVPENIGAAARWLVGQAD